ncbi:glycoside hydrolase [Mycobacterium ostraviense]|uniref:Glycoside hydrolase n=1 Tax=Mycobacterium ostraviense TaxID=2738409 RepID=A0A164C5I1_9MYCO|nr:glycoside hydrolase [Mycobacterium ostraviense]
MITTTLFGFLCILSVVSLSMIAFATLLTLINQVSGTPYIPGGDSPAGTDCSGLASWVSNAATDRPVFGDRFNTGNEEAALAARGFQQGTAPNALVIGWNGGHTAVTLPDGTPVASGEGGGVRIGGGGAYQAQFTHHMYLPVDVDAVAEDAPAPDAPAVLVDAVDPGDAPAPAPDDPDPIGDPEMVNT